MSKSNLSQNSSISNAAARWFIRMQEAQPDSPERTQFECWLMQSELHQAEYASLWDAWNGLDSIDDLQKMASSRQANQLLKQSTRSKKIKNTIASLSVCFIVIFAGLFGHNQYQQWLTSPTMQLASASNTAQIIKQTLEDGSEITLNANSKIQVTYYRDRRHVNLLQGEAIFNVAKDAERPFIVETNTAKIKVLGTRFAVNKLSKLVRVSVDHGSVQLESINPASRIVLHHGEVAEILNGQTALRKKVDAVDYFKFTNGTIVFNQADIVEIADVLSRYRQQPVVAKGQSKEQISAVLDAKDVETFLSTLPKIANVHVQQTLERTLIQANK